MMAQSIRFLNKKVHWSLSNANGRLYCSGWEDTL
jgi:hypothetical protein